MCFIFIVGLFVFTTLTFLLHTFQENALVRAASIHLFGQLSRFGQGPSKTAFLEQVHTNFISILLHLSEELEVTKVCPFYKSCMYKQI